MRPPTPRETVVLMIIPLESIYAHTRPPAYLLGLSELALEFDPKNVDGLLFEADAYFLELGHRYLVRHLRPEVLPPAQKANFNALYRANVPLMNQVEAIGWSPPTQAANTGEID